MGKRLYEQAERLTGKGKSKMSALGAAMRKLAQICYGVIKHQQPYQPQVAVYPLVIGVERWYLQHLWL